MADHILHVTWPVSSDAYSTQFAVHSFIKASRLKYYCKHFHFYDSPQLGKTADYSTTSSMHGLLLYSTEKGRHLTSGGFGQTEGGQTLEGGINLAAFFICFLFLSHVLLLTPIRGSVRWESMVRV